MRKEQLIYIADDHQIMAEGLAKLLVELGYDKVRLFENGQTLCKAILSHKPDFIFLDINMPVQDGIETLRILSKDKLGLSIIVLTMLDEASLVDECIKLGASCFLHKNSEKEEIKLALEKVARNEIYITPSLLSIREQKRSVTENEVQIKLTEKEYEILQHLCNGESPKEIAKNIHLSYFTVETHKKNMMQKLNINSVAKLVSYAFKHKLVD